MGEQKDRKSVKIDVALHQVRGQLKIWPIADPYIINERLWVPYLSVTKLSRLLGMALGSKGPLCGHGYEMFWMQT
jgi:hypothetical protein